MPVKMNGGKAYEEMADAMLERAENGKMTEEEFRAFVVYSLGVTNRRARQSEAFVKETINIIAEYPPLLWLIRKRPRSTIPFLVGLFSLLSGFFIQEIRNYFLNVIGLPGGELPEGTAAVALALTLGGFALSLLMASGEKSLEEILEEEANE